MTSTERSRIARILTEALAAAHSRHAAASKRFNSLLKKLPSGLPHPDGTLRVHNAGREAHASLEEYASALRRYSDFCVHRIVPDDLDPTKKEPD
uniref:Uncharacterized protein n=1 Tax=Solibacter usitatus (strain Ellin6076) TaxID=234267 RepID=Q025I3_SOLUE